MKSSFHGFRRKRVWIPLLVVCGLAASILIVDRRLMKGEAVLYEIGQGIRSRLDDFGDAYKRGDAGVVASYYADEFSGSEFGFARRERISEEGGIILEEWKAPPGPALDRSGFLD